MQKSVKYSYKLLRVRNEKPFVATWKRRKKYLINEKTAETAVFSFQKGLARYLLLGIGVKKLSDIFIHEDHKSEEEENEQKITGRSGKE